MLKRIVRMHFVESKVEDFISIFESSRVQIRNFPGCKHLELLRDLKQPGIFFTISIWESEKDLENYRNSQLFIHTWKQTKALFESKAMAWSLSSIFNSTNDKSEA